MSARTMALKAATKGCALNKIPNTRLGSRLDPGFNYVNLTDDQLRAIRIRKGYGITYKQRHSNLRLGRCIEKNTQRGQIIKNTHETFGGNRNLQRRKASIETPQKYQVPAPALNEVEITDGVLKGKTFGLGFIKSTYKTIIDSKIGCEPSKYTTSGARGRAGRNTVKTSGAFSGGEVGKHRGGQMVASQRPPITVTKCIGFGKKKTLKRKSNKLIRVNVSVPNIVDEGLGDLGDPLDPEDPDGLLAVPEDDGELGLFFEDYTDQPPENGGLSASGVPFQVIVSVGGEIIQPTKGRCNDKQRQLEITTSNTLLSLGFDQFDQFNPPLPQPPAPPTFP